MNHDCNGDFYGLDGKRWYRCLMDSTVIAVPADGLISCPHCERRISATEHGSVTARSFIVTEVKYDDEWHEHSTDNLDQARLRELGAKV